MMLILCTLMVGLLTHSNIVTNLHAMWERTHSTAPARDLTIILSYIFSITTSKLVPIYMVCNPELSFYITLNNNDNLIPRTPLTITTLHQQPTNSHTHISTTDPTPRRRTGANIPHLLCIRLIGIFADEDFADERLHVRRRGGEVDGTGGLFGAEGEGAGDGAVDNVDAGLMDGAAGGVAEEVVLRGDDHGGLGGLWERGWVRGGGGGGGEGTYGHDCVGEVGGVWDVMHAEVEIAGGRQG